MHIPDAYLSPATQATAFVAMLPVWAIAAKRTSRELTTKQAPLLSIGAAFCFAVQMFNIPAVGGTTAHALGTGLLAILVGPWAAVLGLTLSLAIQALLFGDGGILSLGVNCWNMAFVASFVSFYGYRLIAGSSPARSARRLCAAAIGSYAGTVMASLSAGIILGLQPLVAHDAAGHALYCPFGLSVSVPAMVMTHLLVAGPAEAIITVAALAYLWKSFPELADVSARPRIGTGLRLARAFAWTLLLTPLGLIASGSAWGEWELSELNEMVGYVPAGVARSHEMLHPLLPDYGFAGLTGNGWAIAGYLASALVGTILIVAFTRGILARGLLRRPLEVAGTSLLPGKPGQELPSWMQSTVNSSVAGTSSAANRAHAKAPWLTRTVLKMRGTIERTIASETIARSPGLLQSIHPLAKTIGFLSALVATGLANNFSWCFFILAAALVAAKSSSVPMREFVVRVSSSVAFFGLVLAVPILFMTHGATAFHAFGLSVSWAGITSATLILARLAAGISLAILWGLTTRWYQLLQSLRSLGVPQTFLTMATLTYRYLFVTIETLGEMVDARTARQIRPFTKAEAREYAGTGSAILFAKSLAFTEEMHMAMEARSAFSVPARPRRAAWRRADFATVAAGLVLLATVLLSGVIHVI